MLLSGRALENEAVRFRAAIEEYVRLYPEDRFTTDYINPFRGNFPVGCCKSASWMFAHHLTRVGGAHCLNYVWGWRGNVTHGWLVAGDHLVDLTADQFDDENRKVIVARVGESAWHDTFAPHKSHPITLRKDHVNFTRSLKIAGLMEPPEVR